MITLIQPQPLPMLAPAGNNYNISVTSDNVNIVFFRFNFQKIDLSTLQIYDVANVDVYPRPTEPTTGRINITNIAQSLVTSTFDPTSAGIVMDKARSAMIGCVIWEYIYNPTTGQITTGASYTASGLSHFFNAFMNNILYTQYNFSSYLCHVNFLSTGLKKFLTPWTPTDVRQVNNYTTMYYDIFSPTLFSYYALVINIKYSNSPVPYIKRIEYGTQSGTGVATVGVHQINMSPSVLFPGVEANNLESYNVQLVQSDSTGTLTTPLTQVYYFSYQEVCDKPYTVYWLNQFGGWETTQFISADTTLDVVKESVSVNSNSVDSSNYIKNWNDTSENISFNPDSIVTNITDTKTIRLTTLPLSDKENKYLSNILLSKKHYLQLIDKVGGKNVYIPLQLDDTSFSLLNKVQKTDINTKTLTFKIGNNYNY